MLPKGHRDWKLTSHLKFPACFGNASFTVTHFCKHTLSRNGSTTPRAAAWSKKEGLDFLSLWGSNGCWQSCEISIGIKMDEGIVKGMEAQGYGRDEGQRQAKGKELR